MAVSPSLGTAYQLHLVGKPTRSSELVFMSYIAGLYDVQPDEVVSVLASLAPDCGLGSPTPN
jgi:hypothetical protein